VGSSLLMVRHLKCCNHTVDVHQGSKNVSIGLQVKEFFSFPLIEKLLELTGS